LSTKKVLGWHFLPADCMTRYEPRIPVKVGKVLTFVGEPELCKQGLHASQRIIDALGYAPGPVVCRVELSGTIVHGGDKMVATKRKVVAMADASNVLFEFSMDVAARAMERVGWDDERSWNALDIRRAHMMGLADDADLSAARSAARSAAWSAARSAARSAAWSAASQRRGQRRGQRRVSGVVSGEVSGVERRGQRRGQRRSQRKKTRRTWSLSVG
jgi:hypothetical protein